MLVRVSSAIRTAFGAYDLIKAAMLSDSDVQLSMIARLHEVRPCRLLES
jgi:hypothetical protein